MLMQNRSDPFFGCAGSGLVNNQEVAGHNIAAENNAVTLLVQAVEKIGNSPALPGGRVREGDGGKADCGEQQGEARRETHPAILVQRRKFSNDGKCLVFDDYLVGSDLVAD